MRKKVLMINVLFLLITGTMTGQDFRPGTQAAGLLDGKQTMVDYSTGTFHYRIPLFELETGGYKLPVTLGYTAKPIRDAVPAGSFGYNWTLEAGGAVTRIVRGGIADDDTWGFAKKGLATTGAEDVRKVNLREKDGEADIFVATYGGRKISFLVRSNNSGYYAEPLEKTMVKIEVLPDGSYGISGFRILDEQGDLYVFEYHEYTESVYKTTSVSTNDIRDKAHISSWYLTRIELANKEVIYFSYSRAGEEIFQEEIKTEYNYGRQVKNLNFELREYREDFKNAISNAFKAINSWHRQQVQIKINEFDKIINMDDIQGNFFNSNTYFFIRTKLLGTNVLYGDIGNCSLELQRLITSCINYYGAMSQAGQYLTRANNYLFNALSRGLKLTNTGTSTSFTGYKTSRVFLRHIRVKNRELIFEYNGYHKLNRITSYDQFMNLSQVCDFVYESNFLNKVEFKGKDGKSGHRYSFSYYPEINSHIGRDYWGYRNGSSSQTDYYINREAAKYGMIQTITSPLRGTIHVDYESNQANWILTGLIAPYGGLRIKQMITDNSYGQKDTIRYHYPYIGTSVYSKTSWTDVIQYNGFSDEIFKNRIENEGNAFLYTGNTGLYYNYVQEEHVGEGWNTYLFYTEQGIRNGMDVFKFWLCGLPLARAVYDRDGNLLRIYKNTYFSEGITPNLLKWFKTHLPAFRYNSSLNQIKAYPYYLDRSKLSDKYSAQGTIELYNDRMKSLRVRPLEDIYKLYISPRLDGPLPRQNYTLKYGGYTALATQTEYHFSGKVSSTPSIEHLNGDLPAGAMVFSDIEYVYDNPVNSLLPNRVIRKQANGDKIMTLKRTVADFISGTSVAINMMQQNNILSPVVQEQEFFCRSNEMNWSLLREKVTEYDSVRQAGFVFYVPRQEHRYQGNEIKISSFPSRIGSLFIGSKQNYRKSLDIDYYYYYPCRITTPQGGIRFFYDGSPERIKLKVKDTDEKVGYISFVKNFSSNPNIDAIRKYWNKWNDPGKIFRKFYIYQLVLNPNEISVGLRMFMQTDKYKKFIEFLRLFEEVDFQSPMQERKNIVNMESIRHAVFETNFLDEFDQKFAIRDTVEVIWPKGRIVGYDFDFSNADRKQLISEVRKLENVLTPFKMYCMTKADTPDQDDLQLKGNLSPRKYTVMVCARPSGNTLQLSYSYKRGGTAVSGQMTDHVSCVLGKWQLLCFSIDLSTENALSDLRITIPGTKAAAVITPQYVEFQATAFDKEGQVFCRFDHSGNMERYEYDENGRIIATYDAEGYLLNEYKYNIVY